VLAILENRPTAVGLNERESLRYGAAVHEAGHAIVAWAVDLKVCRLRIIGDDGQGASCIECSDHLPILHRIAVAEAGMAAVELLSAPEPLPQAGFSDAVKIRNLLDGYPDDQCKQLIREGCERAREILVDRLSILTDLANALALSGLLDATALIPFMKRGTDH
jgi:ATP-dependent Zn protease